MYREAVIIHASSLQGLAPKENYCCKILHVSVTVRHEGEIKIKDKTKMANEDVMTYVSARAHMNRLFK